MNLGKLERMPCLLQQHVNGKIKLRIVTLELVVKYGNQLHRIQGRDALPRTNSKPREAYMYLKCFITYPYVHGHCHSGISVCVCMCVYMVYL